MRTQGTDTLKLHALRIAELALTIAIAWLGGEASGQTAADRPAARSRLDDLAYSGNDTARAAWRPMPGSSDVSMAEIEGRRAVSMPCTFKDSRIERSSWDHSVLLDLTVPHGVEFEFLCPDTSPVSHFNFYLESGGGWYATSFGPTAATGWSTIRIDKSEMHIEEMPSGWSRLSTIRISAWRGRDQDTVFYVRNLKVWGERGGDVVILRGESASRTASGELTSVCQYSAGVARALDALGIEYSVMSDLDATPPRLAGRKLVILPHNPQMPDAAAAAVEQFLRRGGKMIAFYGIPDRLCEVTGMAQGPYVRQDRPGQFASIRPAGTSPLPGMPATVKQMSWNVHDVKPVPGRSRVVAAWYDQDGKPNGCNAIVASDNCVQMTHVLIDDDPLNKRRLLLAMAGYLVPELWEQSARGTVARTGKVGPYSDLADARKHLATASAPPAVNRCLDQTAALTERAAAACRTNGFAEAIRLAGEADRCVLEAHCLARKPVTNERRIFWCHNAYGVPGMDWDQAVSNLAVNGFTDIQVNMLWGGLAYYDSRVLPTAPEVKSNGDAVAQCLAACRAHGLKLHVWKVNFNLGRSPPDFASRMQKEGRTQIAFDGKPIADWLCPSHPANRTLEIDSMLEVATKYAVDGIHFDYIRYPGREGCFCAGCRERFERSIGSTVRRWPADMRENDDVGRKWLDFRRANITDVVARVSKAARAARPRIEISAAVFPNWPSDRDAVGQDWKLWCDEGYLDYVCPMDYTPYSGEFQRMAGQQIQWAGKARCYPGIGLSCWGAQGDLFTLLDQIDITRALKTGGFTVFNYDATAASEAVPMCGMGTTRIAFGRTVP